MKDMLKSYASSAPARFHMPGHKGQGGKQFDVTEISATDDLTAPNGAILSLEKRFAKAYNAKHSFLLVNGSTAGIHAFLLALGTNKKIAVCRSCHRSIIHGAALLDDDIIFSPTQSLDDIKNTVISSKADAVILTSPNYYGECCDIEAIADFAHSMGILLFVDAAHGAHFPFSNMLPNFPHNKVDMWCTSTHKTLSSLTQTALLHLGSCCNFSIERIRRMLMLENTSSPSFILMQSLENALDDAQISGAWDNHILRIKNLRSKIKNTFSDISVLGDDFTKYDITRLCIDVSKTGNTGYDVALFLEKNNIFPECANETQIVLITTPFDEYEWYEHLLSALSNLKRKDTLVHFSEYPKMFGEFKMSIRSAMFSEIEYIPLENSIGRISASCIGVYPPGSPIIAPGEEIISETVNYLKSHADIYGTRNGAVPCVKDLNVI